MSSGARVGATTLRPTCGGDLSPRFAERRHHPVDDPDASRTTLSVYHVPSTRSDELALQMTRPSTVTRRPRSPRISALPATLLVAAGLAGCGGTSTTDAPPAPVGARTGAAGSTAAQAGTAAPTAVERLVEQSAIDPILAARAGAFSRQVALLAGDLTDAELERLVPAVQEAFAPERLRADVVAFLESEAPDSETVSEVLRFVEEGASAEMRRIADGYEPPLDLQEYTRSLLASPPDRDRVDLVVEWTETQGAGDFFVLLDEALRQAAFEVWGALRPDAPRFTPARGQELQARLLDSFNASVVSFLRSYETVPDSVLAAATEEYASPEGQWYVEAYSLGVAQAMRAAGRRVAAASTSSGG
jgi:hypothetical protein